MPPDDGGHRREPDLSGAGWTGPLDAWVVALEDGQWRLSSRALAGDPRLGGRFAATHLAVVLKDVAKAMRYRFVGNVQAADRRLTEALGILRLIYPAVRVRAGVLELPAEPSRQADQGLTHLLWRTAMVIARETRELTLLRTRFGEIRPREMLVLACVEHLIWVAGDSLIWSLDEPHRNLGLTLAQYERLAQINRNEMCERATNLRHLAEQSAPDVSFHVWKDVGGPVRLKALAWQELADPQIAGPREPQDPHIPVRRALQRARAEARQWQGDLRAARVNYIFLSSGEVPLA